MADLGDYLVLIVVLSAVVAVVSSSAHPQLSSESNMAIGAICLLALASPVISLFNSGGFIPALPDLPDIPVSGGIEEVSTEAFAEGIEAAIVERLGEGGDVEVLVLGLSVSEMRAEKITIVLSGVYATLDNRSLSVWVRDSFLIPGGECEVIINLG